jgi:hypothetical protein
MVSNCITMGLEGKVLRRLIPILKAILSSLPGKRYASPQLLYPQGVPSDGGDPKRPRFV